MYQQKKKIVIVPKCVDGRLQIDKVLQNDFCCDIKIVGNGDPGDPGYYYLQAEDESDIFDGYDYSQTGGFCNPMSNAHVYMTRKETAQIVAIIVLDEPNGNAVDNSFGVHSPALVFEFYPQ